MYQVWSEIFKGVKDPRSERNRIYELDSILGITLLGGIAGIDSFSGLGDFAEAHYEDLREYLNYRKKCRVMTRSKGFWMR